VIRWSIGLLLVVAALAGGGVAATRYFTPAHVEIATILARRGEFVIATHTHGTLRALSSSMMVAPNVGGTLMITDVKPAGTEIKKDQVALSFDREDLQNSVDSAASRVDEAEQTIRKSQADIAIKAHSDQVDLMKAGFAVRRAELDVSKNEMVSAIDAEKNVLVLEGARKKLAQLKEDVAARAASDNADLAVNQEKLNKAKFDRKLAEDRMKQLDVKATMDGIVSVRTNRMASGGMMWPGMELPDYRLGDQVFGGNPVIDVVDNSQLEMMAQIDETDRGNLKEGQAVVIHLHPLPELAIEGKVKSLGGINGRDFGSSPTKTFDCVFSLAKSDERLRPGLSGDVEIITDRAKDVVFLPAQAVIEKDGQKWAFVAQSGGKFQRRQVSTGRRSESQVEITKGLSGGERVALSDPEERASGAKKKSNPLSSSPGGK
jgi:multidrug resistance efflux pump